MTTTDAIVLRGLHKRFGAVAVLADIHLRIAAGEFCVFVGPSGCGKSTLLRLIAGLDDPSAGEIEMAGRRVDALPPAARDVAMVFQSYALYPHMTARENMAFGLRYRRLPAAEIERRLAVAAETLQLGPLLDRKPRELSGGQRQRVAIGRALVREPAVFLFDEPLSNLDATLRVQMRVEIARLHREIGTAAMVYVTHDQVEAMTLADRIVLLRPLVGADGLPSIAQVGSPLALYHRPASRFVAGFIGSPAMNFLPATARAPGGADGNEGLALRLAGRDAVAEVDPAGVAAGEALTAGIRPEHVRLGEGPWRGRVTHVERLGEHSDVHLALADSGVDADAGAGDEVGGAARGRVGAGTTLRARTADERVAIGDVLALDLPARSLHVFRGDGAALPRRGLPQGRA